MHLKKHNLFLYGSLKAPDIFKSVGGLSYTFERSEVDYETLYAEPAMLSGYRTVSPDNVYFYAVVDPNHKVEGYIVYDVPEWVMAGIDRYEGKRYNRESVEVSTANGTVNAEPYLVSTAIMKKHFGDRFHVNLIHELWLRKRIEKFIKKTTRPGDETIDADLERRAHRELIATTERDLVISHYHSDAVSDFFLERELERPLPSIKHLYDDPHAGPFVKNYLALVIKQVLLNQLEDKIQKRYRFELEQMASSERYFKRSISLLAALKMINPNGRAINMIINQRLGRVDFKKYDLRDYVKYAIRAADNIFDARIAWACLEKIRSNFQPGLVPLGAEIELSNLGPNTISEKSSLKYSDPVYDGFRYFYDFGLDVLSWKLGGYIDDHMDGKGNQRKKGFLELAPGRLNIGGELSRPATSDPWLLNQLIKEIVEFYDVRPHSLHLSFQLRKRPLTKRKVLPLGFVKCLLALGGGLEFKDTGRIWVSRMGHDEITQTSRGEELVFARISKRSWYMGEDTIIDKPPTQSLTQIQQYKFIRLDSRAQYEALIMCLKGLQLAYNPDEYLTSEQLKDPKLRRDFEALKKWSAEPTRISAPTISRFLQSVFYGLQNESHYQPAHKPHYIEWCLNIIDAQLKMFNRQIGR